MATSRFTRKMAQGGAFTVFWLMGATAVLIMLFVVGYIMVQGIPQLNLEFFTTSPRGGLSGDGGIYSTVVTTFYMVVVTLLIATPLGVGAAIYLTEYSEKAESPIVRRLVRIARFGVETLAGVPSIIFGLFGYALFVSALNMGFSIMSASLAGACLIIPVVIRTTEEALKSVPDSYREGSLALGATKWETIRKVILPSALPGISTGILLSAGRIVSETAIFFVTLGGSYRVPHSLMSGGRTMALHVYYLAMETRAFDKAMSTAAVLVALIVLMNLAINLITSRISSKTR
ncbi:MAG TPA: phosphate ABC transporter permease PstA [Candidatus Sabulitectum sp.]|nr:phosphate ABC transporter permease PstA [Candidatus Sabulitectum sp.]HPF32527.1 phosphate ABC transporter permease PstA [Candidatus Sabulitectum sp.]HPJ29202.1 phosphate ABC transporter permease PstA [Candidatus Sabulitectum sp.]HPR21464.1 phosphate ABC transporter permease PstA [Candidatus Sabulitectum sp.]